VVTREGTVLDDVFGEQDVDAGEVNPQCHCQSGVISCRPRAAVGLLITTTPDGGTRASISMGWGAVLTADGAIRGMELVSSVGAGGVDSRV